MKKRKQSSHNCDEEKGDGITTSKTHSTTLLEKIKNGSVQAIRDMTDVPCNEFLHTSCHSELANRFTFWATPLDSFSYFTVFHF